MRGKYRDVIQNRGGAAVHAGMGHFGMGRMEAGHWTGR
jgi:hypothetical protein